MESTFDIKVRISRYLRLGVVVFFVILTIALAIGTAIPKKHVLKTIIEMGKVIEGGQLIPIESPEKVKVKVESIFQPHVQGVLGGGYEVDVRIPARSSTIILESKATPEEIDKHTQFHQLLVKRVEEDHSLVAEPHISKLISREDLETIILDEVSDPKGLAERLAKLESELAEAQNDLEQTKEDGVFGRKLEKRRRIIAQLEKQRGTLEDKRKLLESAVLRLSENRNMLHSQLDRVELEYSSLTRVGNGDNVDSIEGAALRQNASVSLMDQITNLQRNLYVVLPEQQLRLESQRNGVLSQISLVERDLAIERAELDSLVLENEMERKQQLAVVAEITKKIEKMQVDFNTEIRKQKSLVQEISQMREWSGKTRPVIPVAAMSTRAKPSTTVIIVVSVLVAFMATFSAVAVRIAFDRIKAEMISQEQLLEGFRTAENDSR